MSLQYGIKLEWLDYMKSLLVDKYKANKEHCKFQATNQVFSASKAKQSEQIAVFQTTVNQR